MTTKTKILSALVLSASLATGAFAYGNKGECDINKSHKMMNKQHMGHKKGHDSIFSTLKKLNLSDSQKAEIKKIMSESKNKESISEAFTKSSFNKDKYIEIMSEKRENMIKSKALKIEKIYSILDEKQKEQFKTLLDLKAERMHQKGMNFDKNSNGRG
ncbi:Spy/CpxP family protein refolding chaperone [Arcobacter sp. YIC-464]|uniref:Spy/CpxP family protein refolding chaperone n=1 Tax=Arcobacter sp. YIC-464 TaxID=3376631 RepID=UPI003C13116C